MRDAHNLARCEHRDGAELDLDPRRILREIPLIEPHDLGLAPARAEMLGERFGALGHEPDVGPIDERSAARRVG